MSGDCHGRCLCGAVQFTVRPPLLSCGHCHCASCRKAHSAAFVTWARVARTSLVVTAGLATALKGYESSPGSRRSFCGTCGSPLFTSYEGEPDDVYLPLGALDDAPPSAPTAHLSYEERASWFDLGDQLPRYRGKTREPIP